jgi:hypothetical protein
MEVGALPADAESARIELDRYRAETDRLRATLDEERLALERHRVDLDRYRAQLDFQNSQRRPMFEAVIRFAEMTVRSLLILNGVAAIALLTFVGNAAARAGALNFRLALIAFGAGAVLSVVTAAFFYVAQSSYAVSEGQDRSHKLGQIFRHAAMTCGFFGLVAFFVGVGMAATAMP